MQKKTRTYIGAGVSATALLGLAFGSALRLGVQDAEDQQSLAYGTLPEIAGRVGSYAMRNAAYKIQSGNVDRSDSKTDSVMKDLGGIRVEIGKDGTLLDNVKLGSVIIVVNHCTDHGYAFAPGTDASGVAVRATFKIGELTQFDSFVWNGPHSLTKA